jgi:hypothetical protein
MEISSTFDKLSRKVKQAQLQLRTLTSCDQRRHLNILFFESYRRAQLAELDNEGTKTKSATSCRNVFVCASMRFKRRRLLSSDMRWNLCFLMLIQIKNACCAPIVHRGIFLLYYSASNRSTSVANVRTITPVAPAGPRE